jgi:hypothetical protein
MGHSADTKTTTTARVPGRERISDSRTVRPAGSIRAGSGAGAATGSAADAAADAGHAARMQTGNLRRFADRVELLKNGLAESARPYSGEYGRADAGLRKIGGR